MDTESPNLPIPSTAPPDLDKTYSQLSQLSNSVQNHQKALENKEKADRMKNLIGVGLKENGESEDTVLVINNFLIEKLNLPNIKVATVKRLGKSQKKARPILVAFDSYYDRKTVLSHCSKLAGLDIYINFDLTREQIKVQQKLREI